MKSTKQANSKWIDETTKRKKTKRWASCTGQWALHHQTTLKFD